MADSNDMNATELSTVDTIMTGDDDQTVITSPGATKTNFIAAKMTDLHLRYKIPYRNGKPDTNAYQLHVKFLIAFTDNFDSSTIRVFDNKNNRIKTFHEPKWMNKEYYNNHFKLHNAEAQHKTVIVHRILSTKPISGLKSDPQVLKHLKSTSTYL
jgi:hypothetical protein